MDEEKAEEVCNIYERNEKDDEILQSGTYKMKLMSEDRELGWGGGDGIIEDGIH